MLNGKIIICANSIEEAEADLAMIKANARAGAVVGCGATTIEGMRGLAEALAPMITDTEPYGVPKREEPHSPEVYIDLEYLFDDYRKGYIGLDELVEGIENAMTEGCEDEDECCSCGCCCDDDEDTEVVENSASELFELYYDGYLSLDELKSSINKLLRKCEKDEREMHNEDTEDYGESRGFTIESAMACFFGGEWD